jgi:hypothetical protein
VAAARVVVGLTCVDYDERPVGRQGTNTMVQHPAPHLGTSPSRAGSTVSEAAVLHVLMFDIDASRELLRHVV